VADPLSARAREIVAVARELLDEHGIDGLTMRRLAERLGIRAPSLYKHLPDKAALEVAVIAIGLEDLAVALEVALEEARYAAPGRAGGPTVALAVAYRAFALAHPHLYLLMTNRPLPRERLPAGVEDRAAAPVVGATGSPARARAFWAFAHGMVVLELAGRFPPDADLDAAWQAGIDAFQTGAASTGTLRRSRTAGVRRASG
jgi:AcrR family transcriptional regulator